MFKITKCPGYQLGWSPLSSQSLLWCCVLDFSWNCDADIPMVCCWAVLAQDETIFSFLCCLPVRGWYYSRSPCSSVLCICHQSSRDTTQMFLLPLSSAGTAWGLAPTQSHRLQVGKRQGGDTATRAYPNRQKGFSIHYDVMLSNNSWREMAKEN